MDLAWISLIALLVVIVFSCTTKVNPGILAMGFAWLIGVYAARWWSSPLSLRDVVAGFPTGLFLTLVGVSLFFAQAQLNGTLERLAHAAVGLCRGNVGLIGLVFFLLPFFFSAVGAGNIAAAALIAPLAMTLGQRAGIPPFLIVILVAHGSLAGALSPISPTGIIANQQMEKMGLGGHAEAVFVHNLIGNAVVGVGGYFLFGGWRLFSRWYEPGGMVSPAAGLPNTSYSAKPAAVESMPLSHGMPPSHGESIPRWERRHVVTLALVTLLIVSVIFLNVDLGMAAFCGSVVLTLGGWADEREAIRKMPWGVILMVCGVTVLTSLLEKTGGTEKFKEIIEAVSTPATVTGVLAFIGAIVSVYSSTSGVVLPAFLPLATRLGGDPLALSLSIIVAGHLVDSSPLSTIGALCIAAAPPDERERLFKPVLVWGLSMALLGAVYCNLMFGVLWAAP